ncbi:MAG: hypothetical protein LBQ43_03800 [Holosporales bacterium]|nr:hypothetical protein [Holosporales bacterium]
MTKSTNDGVINIITLYEKNEAATVDGVDFPKIEPKLNTVFCGSVGLGVRFFMTQHIFISVEGKAMFGSKYSFEHSVCASTKIGNAAPVKSRALVFADNKYKFRDYSIGCVLGCKF